MPELSRLSGDFPGVSAPMAAVLARFEGAGVFSPAEVHAVDLAAERWGEARPDVLLALLLARARLRCLQLLERVRATLVNHTQGLVERAVELAMALAVARAVLRAW